MYYVGENGKSDHGVKDTCASEGSEVACSCLGTHTGLILVCGSYYSAHEAADNSTDEVSVGPRIYTEAIPNDDGSRMTIDNGCGTLIGSYEMGKLVTEAASIASYVGGKPGGDGHLTLGGSYGAGTLAAMVSLERMMAIAKREGYPYETKSVCGAAI